MPERSVKEVRMPELRLPEMTRDDIVRSLSEIHLPEVDLSKVEFPKFDLSRFQLPKSARSRIAKSRADLSSSELGKAVSNIDIQKAVANIDLEKALAGPLVAAGLRPKPRRRWPYVLIGIVIAGIVATFLAKQASSRLRLDEATRSARERVDAITEGDDATFDPLLSNGVPHEEVAVPIEPGAYVSEAAALAFDKADTAV
jgi:hypothetical protein